MYRIVKWKTDKASGVKYLTVLEENLPSMEEAEYALYEHMSMQAKDAIVCIERSKSNVNPC